MPKCNDRKTSSTIRFLRLKLVGNRNTNLFRIQNNRTVLLSLAVVVDERKRKLLLQKLTHIPRMDRESEYEWHTICSEMMQFIESNPFTALLYTASSFTTIQSTSFVWLLFNRQNEHFHHIKLTLDLCGQWLHFCTNSIVLCSPLLPTRNRKQIVVWRCFATVNRTKSFFINYVVGKCLRFWSLVKKTMTKLKQ